MKRVAPSMVSLRSETGKMFVFTASSLNMRLVARVDGVAGKIREIEWALE